MITYVRLFVSHDETQTENRVFQNCFNVFSKSYNNAANKYAEIIFSIVNELSKSDNK